MVSVIAEYGLWGTGSVVEVHRLSCSTACGILPDQGLNPCLLQWQAESYPRCHQGSSSVIFIIIIFLFVFIFGCAWSSLLPRVFSLAAMREGSYSSCSVQASHSGDFSHCGAWAPGSQASGAGAPGFSGATPRLQSTGSVVVVHELSCSEACGIFPDQGSNPCLLHWHGGFSSTVPGRPRLFFSCIQLFFV